MTRALIMAVVVLVPAVVYVSQRTEAARSGYAILRLRDEVLTLRSDNARLLANVTTLKSPERIEHIAVYELGMVAPRQQQLSALSLPQLGLASHETPTTSMWTRVANWLAGEAEAREAR
ncbi:MAG TPA: cell division protein FtsL [bacterium]|nr:cell division protein FtsL [bacterium]